jgi:hypothetical protein
MEIQIRRSVVDYVINSPKQSATWVSISNQWIPTHAFSNEARAYVEWAFPKKMSTYVEWVFPKQTSAYAEWGLPKKTSA